MPVARLLAPSFAQAGPGNEMTGDFFLKVSRSLILDLSLDRSLSWLYVRMAKTVFRVNKVSAGCCNFHKPVRV